MSSPRKRLVALLLALFFGYLGIHRLYVGKWVTALIWFLTGGIVGIGGVVDCILILLGSFRDKEGLALTDW